jgi:hypothetical protein
MPVRVLIHVTGIVEPPHRWGLLPDRAPGEPLNPRLVWRHWFVHFNPLYVLSALSILGGVFLVNRHFDRLDTGLSLQPHIALFGVVQAYELLILGGAAFLVRRAGAVRPAVLLALLECLFLFDGTLRLESLLLRGPGLVGISAAWLLLTFVKMWGLAAALRVPLRLRHYASIAGAATALLLVVHLLAHPATPKPLVLTIAAWLGALVILALDVADAPRSPLAVTDEQRERAARCTRGAFRILTGAYFFHVWGHLLIGGPADGSWIAAVVPQLGAFCLASALRRSDAAGIWGAGLLTLVSALPVPAAMPYALCVVAMAFAWGVWRGTRGGLGTGAAFAVYAALWLSEWRGGGEPLPPLPDIVSWPTLALLVALAIAAWLARERAAMILLSAGTFGAAYDLALRLLPETELGLGILLLSVGFALLVIGLAVNWWLRARACADSAAAGP